jgi:PPOX class probable F420-dependent enzyme
MEMNKVFDQLQEQQFINLTTYRKNGQPVVTTVWFAHDGDRIVGTTQAQAGKIKRMRGTPKVSIAPSTFDGKVLGESFEGVGRVLAAEEFEAAQSALRNKYGARYDETTGRTNPAVTRVFWEVKPV